MEAAGCSSPAGPTSAVIADVCSPHAALVAALARDVELLAVCERPEILTVDPSGADRSGSFPDEAITRSPRHDRGAVDPLITDAWLLARAARLVVCPDAAVAALLAPALQRARRDVPLEWPSTDPGPASPGPLARTPAVAVLGDVQADEVRLAWARLTQRWPEAVLISDLEDHPAAARERVLRESHVVVVLAPGRSNLEQALGSGATVVAHADAVASGLITHGVDGLLTDGRVPDLLAATLDYALTYHEQLAPVRAASLALVRGRVSAATLAHRVLAQLDGRPAPGAFSTPVTPPSSAGRLAASDSAAVLHTVADHGLACT